MKCFPTGEVNGTMTGQAAVSFKFVAKIERHAW